MKKSALIWFLSLILLLSLASASVFAEEDTPTEPDDTPTETTDEESADAEPTDEPVADENGDLIDAEPDAEYIEYPCVDADGNLVESPLATDVPAEGEGAGDATGEEGADEADPTEPTPNMLLIVARLADGEEEVDDTPVDGDSAETGDEEPATEDDVPLCELVNAPEEVVVEVGPPPPPVNPWYGIYWNNPTFTGQPALTRPDDYVDFNWGNESPFTPTMGADYNSIRWTHTERVQPAGFYRVRITSDYGARLDVNGARIVDTIRFGNAAPFDTYYWIRGGINANFRFDYFHHEGVSIAKINVEQQSEWAAPFGYGTISESPVLRDGPGTEYWSNGRLANGQRVKLTGQRNLPGNWVGVITDEGEAGWVNTYYLLTSYPVDKMQIWPFTPDGVTAGEPRGRVSTDFPYINLRYQPKSDSNVIAQAPQGMYLALVGRTSSSNYLLVRMWEGTLGWAPRGGIDTNINIHALPIRYDDTVPAAE